MLQLIDIANMSPRSCKDFFYIIIWKFSAYLNKGRSALFLLFFLDTCLIELGLCT